MYSSIVMYFHFPDKSNVIFFLGLIRKMIVIPSMSEIKKGGELDGYFITL